MAVRISQFLAEGLYAAHVPVVPQPISISSGFFFIPALFECNWEEGVTLSTVWQTDTARSASKLTRTSISLHSRPTRVQQASLLSIDAEEAMAMVHMANWSVKRGYPIPIYPDEVAVEGIEVLDAQNWRVYGDYRWRRFYTGMRVALTTWSARGIGDRVENAQVAFVELKEAGPFSILVNPLGASFDPGTIVTSYPMMDCRASTDAKGDFLTLDRASIAIESVERQAGSTLPPSWTGHVDSLARVLSPDQAIDGITASDGRPVFPLDWIDWERPQAFSKSLFATEENSGKGTILTPRGDRPLMGLSSIFQGCSRKDLWKFLNFFDAMRGRAGSFWFPALANAWEVKQWRQTSNGAVNPPIPFEPDQLLLQSLNGSWNHRDYTHLLLVSSNGEPFAVRRINDVSDSPTGIVVDFDPLTIGVYSNDLYSVVPAHLMTFKDDSLTEDWKSTEYGSCSFELQEEEEKDDVPYTILEQFPDKPFGTLSLLITRDCIAWFDASRNVYETVDEEAGRLRICTPYPGERNKAERIYDAREDLPSVILAAESPEYFLENSSTDRAHVYTFRDRSKNGGKATIYQPHFYYSAHTGSAPGLHPSQRDIWNNETGFTVMLCLTAGTYTGLGSNFDGILVKDALGTTLLRLMLHTDVGTAPNIATGQVAAQMRSSGTTATAVCGGISSELTNIVMLRWVPGERLRIGCSTQTQSPTTFASFDLPATSYATDFWFDPTPFIAVDDSYEFDFRTRQPGLNALMFFNRGLTAEEVNEVASAWRAEYGPTSFEPASGF